MRAVLNTLCGCSREMSIPFPPNPEIIIPLRTDRLACYFDEDMLTSKVLPRRRRFRLDHPGGGPFGTARYEEISE